MQLQELIDTVNDLYFNNSSSFRIIQSKASELLKVIGHTKDIKHINSKVINQYIAYLQKQKNKPATINSKLMYLSKLLTYALRNNLIDKKPYIPTFKIQSKKDISLASGDIDSMLSYCTANNLPELYQVIAIGYYTGIRVSNILQLQPEDIEDDYIRVWQNKTNTPYSVPINSKLKALIDTSCPQNSKNYIQIHYQFKKMVKELGLNPKITIHTLRHSTCTKLIKEGVPLPVVQAIMNHKNIQTTLQYNHLCNKQLEDAVCVL